jgi:signal transduction histidine kinase/ligand-binding sensor domain-containing protein
MNALSNGSIAIVVWGLLICTPHQTRTQILPFEHYTSANGLLSNATTVLFQDSRGYLHVGSAEGLSTFDGYSFTHTRTKNGLPSNFINSITELPSFPATIWICTNGGLARKDGDRITTILLDTTALSRLVYAIEEDAARQLWCATHEGLYIIRDSIITRMPLPAEDGYPLSVLTPGPDSLVWVPVGNLLLAFSPARTLVHRIELSASRTNHITSAFRDRSGNVWIGLRDSSLSVYRHGVRVHKRFIPSGRVLHMMEDSENRLYLGTENGLLSIRTDDFATGTWARIGVENGLPARTVNAGIVDREGMPWFSCTGFGIAKLTTSGLIAFPISDIPEAYNNMRAACDTSGRFWVLSGVRLVEVRQTRDSEWRMFTHGIEPHPHARPSGIICDRKNRLWLIFPGTGIRSYAIHSTATGKSELRLLEGVPTDLPRALIIDRRGRRWWIDEGHLNVSDGERTRQYDLVELIGEPDVRTLYEDSKGRIWFGGFSHGIAMVYGDSLDAQPRLFIPYLNLSAGFIRAFCEDRFGRIWVGTRYNGCLILDEEESATLSSSTVLPSDAVWTISHDSSGLMWLGTSEGLVAIDPATLLPAPISQNFVREAVTSSGVSPGGMFWYVTRTGLGLVDIPSLRLPSAQLEVCIARWEINGTQVDVLGEPEFTHDRNNCVLTFLASTLHGAQDVLYQYKLVGAENDWQVPTRERSVTYASLRPGKYTFLVRAARNVSSEFGPAAAVSFTITPPFWEEWWFRATALAVVVAFVAGIYRRRVAALQREKLMQHQFTRRLVETQESERKRIAGELHDSLVQNLLVAKNRSLMGLENVQNSERAAQELNEISSTLGSAIEEVREIAHNLRPYQLDRLGFTRAVRSLLSKVSASTSIRFHHDIEDLDACLNAELTIQLYRIVQEALNNILKHSGATSVTISLRRDDAVAELSMSDDGKGISTERTAGNHFGLDGIAMRAALMGGTSHINSLPGKGTTVVVRIPITLAENGKEDSNPDR